MPELPSEGFGADRVVELPEERGAEEGRDTAPLDRGVDEGLETAPPDRGALEGLATVPLDRGALEGLSTAPLDRGADEGRAIVPRERSGAGAAVSDGRLGTIRAPPMLSITRRGTGAVRSGDSAPEGREGDALRQSEVSLVRGAVPVRGTVGRARHPSSL